MVKCYILSASFFLLLLLSRIPFCFLAETGSGGCRVGRCKRLIGFSVYHLPGKGGSGTAVAASSGRFTCNTDRNNGTTSSTKVAAACIGSNPVGKLFHRFEMGKL